MPTMRDDKTGRRSRREFLATVGGAAAWTRLAGPARAAAEGERRPNVLILQPDQHRGTIMRCAGDAQAVTPSLDRLAAEGVRFTNCASASPVCSPFRGSLQTGLYPHAHGVTRNNIRMDPGLTTFAEVFEAAGYATGYIGKWHLDGGWPPSTGGEGVTPKAVGGLVPTERRQGWQQWHGYEKSHEFFEVWKYDDQGKKVRVEGHDWEPAWHTDMALEFIRDQRDAGKPWLYYVAFGPPHLPEQCPQEFLDLYDPDKFVLPPDVEAQLPRERQPQLRQQMRMYYAQVTAIDHEVGRLMEGLERLGVEEDTVVLYTSDHGDYLGSHAGAKRRLRGKGSPHATAFRIPLIVRWPDQVSSGQVRNALVSSVDLAPTVLDLAGLPIPEQMQGYSMADWCVKGAGHRRDAVYLGLGDNRPIPPEAIRPSNEPAGKPTLTKALPAGEGLGDSPTYKKGSGNWDCGYDERIVVELQPGKHRVTVAARQRGRIEVSYALRDYVEGRPRFELPTSAKYTFDTSPENEFVVGRDGSVTNAESLRPHLYGAGSRKNPPTFVLECDRPFALEIQVTKSVGDRNNQLAIYVDASGKPRYGGWWRAVWDGRYVYRPGRGGWLYDHREDPHEMANLIDSPEHAGVRRTLAARLLEFAQQTDDPVLPELREMLREA